MASASMPDAEQAVTSFAPDQRVAEWFLGLSNEHPLLADVGAVLAVALHPWVFRVAVAVAAVFAWRRGRRRVAVAVVSTMAVGGSLGVALKLLIARPRPAWGDPVAAEVGYSMPSGHALNAALGSALLVLLAWPWLRTHGSTALAVVAAAALTAVAMLDRLVLGVHYLSDVLAGAVLGTVMAVAAARVTYRHPARTEVGGGRGRAGSRR